MSTFRPLKSENDLQEIIKAAFDTDLDIQGSWGYRKETATTVLSTTVPLVQFEHMFASMRTYVEMNMTLSEDTRYGSINLNEIKREQITKENLLYDKVTYEVTAIHEKTYATFISEYKEGYGTDSFDISKHFKEREASTLHREVTHWYEVSNVH